MSKHIDISNLIEMDVIRDKFNEIKLKLPENRNDLIVPTVLYIVKKKFEDDFELITKHEELISKITINNLLTTYNVK